MTYSNCPGCGKPVGFGVIEEESAWLDKLLTWPATNFRSCQECRYLTEQRWRLSSRKKHFAFAILQIVFWLSVLVAFATGFGILRALWHMARENIWVIVIFVVSNFIYRFAFDFGNYLRYAPAKRKNT